MKIKSIKRIQEKNCRYDITVDDYSCYIANGIVVHNTDGQNLLISWKNGKLIASRNKGHQKNYGENALDKKGLSDKFAGRGELSIAFNNAFNDLDKALSSLSNKELDYIFGNGRRWASLEVMTPKNENIIHYGVSELRFHGILELGPDGNPVSQLNQSFGRYIAKQLRLVNANIQKNFEIKGLSKINLDSIKNSDTLIKKYVSQLNGVFSKYGLGHSDTITDYQKKYLIKNYLPNNLNPQVRSALLDRWIGNTSTNINTIYKLDPDNKDTIRDLDKEVSKQFTKMMEPIDTIFASVGAIVVKNIKTLMTVNPDASIRNIRSKMSDAIDKISKSNNDKLKDELKRQMNRIQSLGGEDSIMPTEGITFFYNGELLKLTGSFSAANQLINLTWKL